MSNQAVMCVGVVLRNWSVGSIESDENEKLECSITGAVGQLGSQSRKQLASLLSQVDVWSSFSV